MVVVIDIVTSITSVVNVTKGSKQQLMEEEVRFPGGGTGKEAVRRC